MLPSCFEYGLPAADVAGFEARHQFFEVVRVAWRAELEAAAQSSLACS